MTKLWEILRDAMPKKEDDGFRQKNHMVNAGRRRRVNQVRASGTSEGAEKGWDDRVRRRAGEDELDDDAPVDPSEDSRSKSGTIAKPARGHSSEMFSYGTPEGAEKGWDSRGRGRAKKNFEPASSVQNKVAVGTYFKAPGAMWPYKVTQVGEKGMELAQHSPTPIGHVMFAPWGHPNISKLQQVTDKKEIARYDKIDTGGTKYDKALREAQRLSRL